MKTGSFKPEYAGKLNFYLSAADSLLRMPLDAPTLGLLLCEVWEGAIVDPGLCKATLQFTATPDLHDCCCLRHVTGTQIALKQSFSTPFFVCDGSGLFPTSRHPDTNLTSIRVN